MILITIVYKVVLSSLEHHAVVIAVLILHPTVSMMRSLFASVFHTVWNVRTSCFVLFGLNCETILLVFYLTWAATSPPAQQGAAVI